MNNLEASYKLILNNLREISETENFYFKPIKPKLSDIEIISLIVLAEFKSIDSEHQLFRDIKGFEIEPKIERSVYNRRKRKLFPFLKEIRMKMVDKFNESENYFIVDSMPLEVCKILRSSRTRFVKMLTMLIPIKDFVLRRTYIFMDKNYMQFVLFLVFFRVLIFLLHLFTTFIICKILNFKCLIVCCLEIKVICLKPFN